MLPLLFSANDRNRNRKRGNDAGDKSRMHLQESLRENSLCRGYEAQTATQFLQSKTQELRVIVSGTPVGPRDHSRTRTRLQIRLQSYNCLIQVRLAKTHLMSRAICRAEKFTVVFFSLKIAAFTDQSPRLVLRSQ